MSNKEIEPWNILAFTLLSSPAIFAILRASLSLEAVDPFFIIGIFSLMMLLLADTHSEVMILFFISALASFVAFTVGYFSPFLSLASGYVFILPFFILLSSYREASPEALILIYFFSLLIAVDLLYTSKAGSFTPTSLLYPSLFIGVGDFQPSINFEVEYQIFSGLTAISTVTVLWRILSRTSYRITRILHDSHVLSAGLLASSIVLTFVLSSKTSAGPGGWLPISIALCSTLLIIFLLRLLYR
ncbi:MAG: hypothetical protein ACUVTM_01565 [Candidatus Bathyarchaeia archaeon]